MIKTACTVCILLWLMPMAVFAQWDLLTNAVTYGMHSQLWHSTGERWVGMRSDSFNWSDWTNVAHSTRMDQRYWKFRRAEFWHDMDDLLRAIADGTGGGGADTGWVDKRELTNGTLDVWFVLNSDAPLLNYSNAMYAAGNTNNLEGSGYPVFSNYATNGADNYLSKYPYATAFDMKSDFDERKRFLNALTLYWDDDDFSDWNETNDTTRTSAGVVCSTGATEAIAFQCAIEAFVADPLTTNRTEPDHILSLFEVDANSNFVGDSLSPFQSRTSFKYSIKPQRQTNFAAHITAYSEVDFNAQHSLGGDPVVSEFDGGDTSYTQLTSGASVWTNSGFLNADYVTPFIIADTTNHMDWFQGVRQTNSFHYRGMRLIQNGTTFDFANVATNGFKYK